MLNKIIDKAEETDPMIYRLSNKQNIPSYENPLPIHRKIYDVARLEFYELHKKLKK